jgi:hypothetical protein
MTVGARSKIAFACRLLTNRSKAKSGMGDEYLKGLAKTFKGSLEEAKKQDLILDYKILLGDAATPQDFDILLMVESKNMAALDNAREKFDPIARKIVGTPAAAAGRSWIKPERSSEFLSALS